jgi:outer membrane protein N
MKIKVSIIVALTIIFCSEKLFAQTAQQADPEAALIRQSEQQQAREREKEAGEDPLKQREKSKVDTPDEHASKPNEFGAHASLRVRYRGSGGEGTLDDGGSRIGANADWQFRPGYWLGGQAEAGFNLLDRLDSVFNPGASSSEGEGDVFLRLFYANLETPHLFLVLGKAWSTYYSVAGFTDRFAGTGGSASGAFNAGTDGGPSGTGRADEVLQTRIHIEPAYIRLNKMKPFTLNVQLQHGQEIPSVLAAENSDVSGFNYGYAFGLSALLQTRDNLNLGIAYNRAQVSEEDLPELRSVGIDGDSKALLLGAKWFSDKWYFASNFSWMWNHMTTEEGVYFDGKGWETYGQYNLCNRWWMTGGWNFLKPNDNQIQAGNYQVKYGVVGLRYSFEKFNRMLYANVRFDSSTTSDANERGLSNTYTVGIRWNIPR